MSVRVELVLDDEQLAEIAAQAAALIAERTAATAGEGFLDVAKAAEFLACPTSRVYALVSAKRIPHYKDGSRTLFDRAELREFVRAGGARRP